MDKFGRWPFVLLTLGFIISTVYQYGFWSSFGLNVFQYFDPADVLKNFVYVALSSFKPYFVFIAFAVFNESFLKLGERFDRQPLASVFGPDGTTTWPTIFKACVKAPFFFPTIALIAVGFALTYYAEDDFDHYPKFLVHGLVISVAAYVATMPTYDFIGLPSTRWALTLFVGIALLSSLKAGKEDANKIIHNRDFFLTHNKENAVSNYKTPYFKLVGRAGDLTVFVSANNQATIFLTDEQLSKIQLMHSRTLIKNVLKALPVGARL